MTKFGWSLPAGCNNLPGEEPEEPDHVLCPHCNTKVDFSIRLRTDSIEEWSPWSHEYHTSGPDRTNPDTGVAEVLDFADSWAVYQCPNCQQEYTSGNAIPVYCDDLSEEEG